MPKCSLSMIWRKLSWHAGTDAEHVDGPPPFKEHPFPAFSRSVNNWTRCMRKSAPRHSGHRIPEPWWRHGVTGLQVATRLPWLPSQARPSHVTSPQAKPSQTHISCLTVWNLGRLNRVWQDRCTQVYSGFTPLTGGPIGRLTVWKHTCITVILT